MASFDSGVGGVGGWRQESMSEEQLRAECVAEIGEVRISQSDFDQDYSIKVLLLLTEIVSPAEHTSHSICVLCKSSATSLFSLHAFFIVYHLSSQKQRQEIHVRVATATAAALSRLDRVEGRKGC